MNILPKKRITLYIPAETVNDLEAVAKGAHTDATKYAALVVSKFSELAPTHALDAIAAIPKRFFRGAPEA